MGRFPWTQGHHKQPSDKFIPSPDWFTKSNGEPSRQTPSESIREHTTVEFDSTAVPTSFQARSRSATVSSFRSHYTKSSLDRSAEVKSRPQSRQSIIEDGHSLPATQEPMARSLFSKGSRIIRRKTSRMTLLPSRIEEAPPQGRQRDQEPSRIGYTSQISSLSPTRTLTKPNISDPFDFQHVTHTEQGQFRSLDTASRNEIASEFDAVQAGQQPATEIRGIAVSNLPASPKSNEPGDASQSPRSMLLSPDLPTTPPRPEPPPKDEVATTTSSNIRLSRSMENFSRPTRSLFFGGDFSPIKEAATEADAWAPGAVLSTAPPSPLSWVESTNETLTTMSVPRRQSVAPAPVLDKPLPLPPTIGHAFSTDDDSALSLRTAPLPQLPLTPSIPADRPMMGNSQQLTEQGPMTPRKPSLRHVQTFPSSKVNRRSQSSGEMTLGAIEWGSALSSPITFMMAKPNKRTSVGIAEIDIEDWEDAIDYSWEYPADIDDEREAGPHQFEPVIIGAAVSEVSLPRNMHAYINRPLPMALTPVMEQRTPELQQQVPSVEPRSSGPTEKAVGDLQGLGIDSLRPSATLHTGLDATFDRDHVRENLPTPARRRDPGSPISKSSSQESIILSIASSIIGTHRSSNSSTSLGDISQLASIEDEGVLFTDRAMLRMDSVEGHISDSSQETVITEPKPTSTLATNTLPAFKLERGISISDISVPNRTSSVAASTSRPKFTRQRSSTLSGRPKNVRVSYSLFPASRPQQSPS